jgi:hypothetical protein
MRTPILNRIAVILIQNCIILATGCSSSSTNFRYDNTQNDSLFVQRDVGAKVFIIMNNGNEYSGELLIVRDSTMLLCKEYEASEEDLLDLAYPLYSLKNHAIKIMGFKGENHLVGGMVFGGLVGIILGAIIGYAILVSGDYHPFDSPLGYIASLFLIGGGLGMLIGGSIGGNSSTYDEVVYENANAEDFDFTKLNIYSRYGSKEPNYLKEIK